MTTPPLAALQESLRTLGFIDMDEPEDDARPAFQWRMIHPQTAIDVGQFAIVCDGQFFVEFGIGSTLASAVADQLHRAHKTLRDELDDAARRATDAASFAKGTLEALDRHRAHLNAMREILALAKPHSDA